MSKLFPIAVLAGVFLISVTTKVAAIVTFDVAQGASNVVTSISDMVKEGGEKLKEVKKKYVGSVMGDGSEGQKFLNTIKQGKEMYDAGAEAVEKAKNDPKVKAAQISAQIASIQKEIKENEQMKEEILAANAEDFAAVESNINGQIKLYQDNNAAIQSMMAQEPAKSEEYNTYMASNNEQIEALQQLLIQTQKQGEQEISSAIAELDNKIKTLKQQQRDLTAELAQYVQDSLPETADSAAYLEAAADSVFIPADASEDVEAMDKIRRARQLERRNQAISAFETLAILRQELEPLAEEAAEMKAAASAADSASGNIGLNTAIKTSVIKSFFNYAKQQATVLKRETAREYAASVAYKRAEPDRDISTFNLDDYKFELPEGVKGCADVNK